MTNITLRRRRMAGLSLIELMISVAIGLLVVSAVLALFVRSSTARNEIERTSRQIENGRYAVELISDDLRLAGYWGEFNPNPLADPALVPTPCPATVADLDMGLAVQVQGYDGGTGAPGCLTSGLNVKAGTDIMVIRRARTCEADAAACAVPATKPQLQVSLCATDAANHIVAANNLGAFILMKKDCATPAGRRQYMIHAYYIGNDNGAGVNVPTLKRAEWNGATFDVEPLVEGIEELNVEYGLDSDSNGSPENYSANPPTFNGVCGAAACTPVQNWRNVVTARFHVIARNLDATPGYTDNKTYTLGTVAAGGPYTVTPGGSFRRHVYSSLVQLVNPSGRRDTP